MTTENEQEQVTTEEISKLAQQVREKIALEDENRNRKTAALKSLRVKELIEQMIVLEDELEKATREEITYRDLNSMYLASSGSDCSEVKSIIAQITGLAEGKNKEERDAWLVKARKNNDELKDAIERQRQVNFTHSNLIINIESKKRKLEGIRAVLYLRTAQIRFLTETSY